MLSETPHGVRRGGEETIMQYLMLVCTDPQADPYDRAADTMGGWVEKYDALGWRRDGERLREPHEAVTVRVRQGQVLKTDGPFAETKEGIAGFDLLDCPHLDAAIEVAAAHSMARFGRIELRPLVDDPAVPTVDRRFPSNRDSLYNLLLCTDSGAEPYDPAADDVADWLTTQDAAGVLVQGRLLQGRETATLVRRRGTQLLVTDGPFAETKESVLGFAVLACRSLEDAVARAATHPAARFGCIEVRAFWPFE